MSRGGGRPCELQTDGRIAYAGLGLKVGLSPSAARQRLQRLLDSRQFRSSA
ncbi:AsnC family transcriptional regulator [Streptomyces sp. NBC_00986]|nr:AsnC family transcriptional regulator [Streptomyces sp. NBC_00986]